MTFKSMDSAGYLVNHLGRLFAEGLRKRIKPLGIVPGQFPALLELWERDGQTQKQLVDKLDVEQATLANTLARMERDGLIVRKEHPEDARVRTIHLTDKSRVIRDRAYEAAQETNRAALAGLSTEERRQFIELMQRTIATMRKGR